MNFKSSHQMAGMDVHRRGIGRLNAALLAGVCINIACMLYYVLYGYSFVFHSDSAVANLLAQEILDSGNFFPRDWQYVNGDLWVVFMHAWMVPILTFVKNGFAAHAIAGVIGCALILAGTWCVTAVMQFSVRSRLVALLLITSGLSPNFSENIFGQQAYGTMYFMSCFILYTAWRFLQAGSGWRWAWALTNLVLITLSTMSNPQRAVVYYLLPTLVSAFALGLLPQTAAAPTPRVRLGVIAGLTGAGAVAGALLHGYVLALGHSSLLPMPVVWITFEAMTVNALGALRGIVSLLGGWPQAGLPIAGAASAIMALRLLAALTILFLLPWAALRYLNTGHPGRQFVAAAGATSLALTLFVFMTSTLAATSDIEASIRYIVPGLVVGLLVLVGVIIDERGPDRVRRLAGTLALAILAFSAPFAYGLKLPATPALAAGVDPTSTSANPSVRLAYFLERQGLHYGYATFWNAGRTTVFSDGAVKVRQILIENGTLRPHHHLSADHWYEPAAWAGPSFLLLSADEAKTIDWDALAKTTGKIQQRLTYENYVLATFDHNIARDFPQWSVTVREPLHYLPSAATPHQIGTYTEGPPALTAHKGEAGALRYGPYQRLAAGQYCVRYDIDAQGIGVSDFGTVDVVAAGGKVLASAHVTAPGVQHITLPFNAKEQLLDVEFRVFSSGNGTITFYQAELSNEQPH